MPLQIMKYQLQINNLIFLCSYLSRQHAILIAKEKGINVDTHQDHISIDKHQKIFKYAMAAGFVFDDFDGQHIEGYSVVRIYKEAPILFKLLNHIDKSFQVICKQQPDNKIHISTFYSPSADFPAIVKKAFYFMTSSKFCMVPDSETLISREGYNLGLGNLKENTVSINLEFIFDLEVLIHEIVHLKHGNWNEQIVQEATDMVLRDCSYFLKNIESLKSKLEKEFNRIVGDFARFDCKVGQILGINKNRALSPAAGPGVFRALNIS